MKKLEPNNDSVQGPSIVDTEEQYRTRSIHANEERPEDAAMRTDPTKSTLQQNMIGHAGVDDRGVEDRGVGDR